MKPSEIIQQLQGESASDEAWSALDALVRARANRLIHHDGDRDEARQNVLLKFAQQVHHGTLSIERTDDGAVVRYVDKMIQRFWHTGHRKVRGQSLTSPEAFDKAAGDGPHFADAVDEEEGRRHAMALLEETIADTLKDTEPRYREGRARAIRQMIELFSEESTVAEVVMRDEGLSESTPPAALKRAFDAAMKNHQRAREALLATARRQHGEGRRSASDLAMIERVVLEFRRR